MKRIPLLAAAVAGLLLAGCQDRYGRVDYLRSGLLGAGVGAGAGILGAGIADTPRISHQHRYGRPYGYGGGYPVQPGYGDGYGYRGGYGGYPGHGYGYGRGYGY